MITGSIEGFVEVWDFDSGKLAKDLKYQAEDEAMVHEDSVVALCVSRDSDYIASGTSKGEIRVWRLKTGGCIQKFVAAHTGSISCTCSGINFRLVRMH